MSEVSPLAKTVAFTAVTLIIAFSALIASLPLPLPSHQSSAAPAINTGDNAWMIVATVFGFFLSPALAFLYGTLLGGNVSELVRNVVVTGSMITFLWVLFSFSLIYGKDAGRNGVLSYPRSYYMFANTINEVESWNGANTIPASIFAVFELGFALVTPTIIACSLHGRTGLPGFMFFIFCWHLCIYCPVAHIVWNYNGAFFTNYVTDFAGGMVVHMLAAVTSLSLHLVLGKDTIPKPGPVADPEKALYLAFLVWFLWFGFISGKAHKASQIAAQAIVNTIAAGFVSVLMSFFYNLIFEKPTTSVTIAYALLIGLVAITPAAGYVTVGGAMCIALSTYLVTAYVSHFVTGEGVNTNEPFSVLTVHSVAGTMGFVWTAIISYEFVNPAANNGLTWGRGVPLGYHLAAMCAMWGTAFVATFILAFICNLIVPLGETGADYAYKTGVPSGETVEKAEPYPTSGADDVVKEKETALELTSV